MEEEHVYYKIQFIFKDDTVIEAAFRDYITIDMFENKKTRKAILKMCKDYKLL